ncbi:MAG: type VI secretion system contractile sheath small subunit [Pseudomonadota bacterium]
MPSEGQGFIGRNRPPRVHITYEDPYDAEQLVELPFVMGVLADLSGNAGKEKPEVNDRTFSQVDMDNFTQFMVSLEPGVAMAVANKLDPEAKEKLLVKLNFKSMDDFSPAAVARSIEPTAKLLKDREQLTNLLRYMDGKSKASAQIKELINNPKLMEALQQRMGGDKEAPLAADSATPADGTPDQPSQS